MWELRSDTVAPWVDHVGIASHGNGDSNFVVTLSNQRLITTDLYETVCRSTTYMRVYIQPIGKPSRIEGS